MNFNHRFPFPLTIRQRMFGLAMLLLLLSLVSVGYFSYRNVNTIILKNAYASNYTNLNIINDSFQDMVDRTKWKINQYSDNLSGLVNQYENSSTWSEKIEQLKKIDSDFQYFLLSNPEFGGAMIINRSQSVYSGAFPNSLSLGKVKELPVYQEMKKEKDQVGYTALEPYAASSSLLFGKQLNTGTDEWIMLFLFNPSYFIKTPAGNGMFIYREGDACDDRSGCSPLWFSGDDVASIDKKMFEGIQDKREGNYYYHQYYLTYIKDAKQGLTFVNTVDLHAFQERLSQLFDRIIVIVLLLLVVFGGLSYVLSGSITGPLLRLKKGMKTGELIDGVQEDKIKISNRLSLRAKLMLFFVVHTIVPTAILGVMIYYSADVLIIQKVQSEIERTVINTKDTIQSLKQGVIEFTGELANFDDVQQLVSSGQVESATISKSINEDIAKQGKFIQQVSSIQIYDIRGNLRYATSNIDNNRNSGQFLRLFRDTRTFQTWGNLEIDNVGNVMFSYYRQFRLKYSENQNDLKVSGIKEDNIYAPVGYIRVGIQQSQLQDRIRSLQWGTGSSVYLLDRHGLIVSALNKRYLSLSADTLNMQGLYGNKEARTMKLGNDWLVSYPIDDGSGWSLVVQVPMSELKKDNYAILRDTFYMLVVVALINAVLSIYLTWRITEPISELSDLLNQIRQGNYDVKLSRRKEKDELTLISRQFNLMTGRIHSLINEVYESKIRENELEMNRQQMEQSKNEAEIIAFQSQINPHFLYNTFSSIHFMIAMGRTEEATRMLNALGRLFSKGVFRGTVMVDIQEEIEHVKAYLEIQEMRFGDKLKVNWDIEPELFRYNMIKLTLQPLVENAIYHGIERKESGGEIRIRGEIEEGLIQFVIADTGLGMSALKLSEVQWVLKGGETRQIGLKNVDNRIKLYFGANYGLTVNSIEHQGTTVFMRFPIQADSIEERE